MPERKTKPSKETAPRTWPGLVSWGVLLLATVLLCYPLWLNRPNLPWGSDTAFTAQSVQGFSKALGEGVLYPRWIGDSNRAFGAPTFTFYPPLAYYAATLGKAITGDVLSGIRFVFIIAAFLSGLSFFISFREESSEIGAALGAALYILVPYRVLDLYWRFAFAEYVAFIWFPLLFLFARRLTRQPTWGAAAGLAASYAGLVLTHLVTAYMALLVLGPYILCRLALSRRWANLAPIVGAGALGLLCAAVYLVPMLAQRPNVHLEWIRDSHFGDYHRNFVYRDEFKLGYMKAPIKPLVNRTVSTQGVLALAALALFAWQLVRTRGDGGLSRSGGILVEGTAQAILCVWTFLLQVPLSAPVWHFLPELATVQFPWRFAAFQALAACALVTCVLRPRGTRSEDATGAEPWPWPALLVVCLAALPMLATSQHIRGQRSWGFSLSRASQPAVRTRVMYEYIPIGIEQWRRFDKTPLPSKKKESWAHLLGQGDLKITRWATHARELQVSSPASNTLQIRTFAYPGWTAHVDGEEVPVSTDKRSGSIQVEVPAGTHHVEIQFGATPDTMLGAILSGFGFLGLAGCVILAALRRGVETSLHPGT